MLREHLKRSDIELLSECLGVMVDTYAKDIVSLGDQSRMLAEKLAQKRERIQDLRAKIDCSDFVQLVLL